MTFDPDAPLPDLHIPVRGLGYCWPTLGESCGNCHRCTDPKGKTNETV